MKKQFTKEYITQNAGCYESGQLEILFEKVGGNPTLRQLFDAIPIKDFCWFLVRKCELTKGEKVNFAILCATQVLPIYEEKYPNDKRVSDCIDETKRFVNEGITAAELRVFMDDAAYAAYAAYAAAYAAYAAANAAYAAAADDDAYNAAAAAAAADDAAYNAAAAADDADADADADAFKNFVWEFTETL